MFFLLSVILFLSLCSDGAMARVMPTFSCWYLSYGNQSAATMLSSSSNNGARPQFKTLNLMWGYESNEASNLVVYPQQQTGGPVATRNLVLPLEYNGQQTDVFKPGQHPFAFVTVDARNLLLGSGAEISWALLSERVTVTRAQLTNAQRCAARFPTHCPLKYPHFCEDGLFCNGEEACTPNFVHSAVGQERYGACRVAAQAPVCPPDLQCNERTLDCTTHVEDTVAPTKVPTTRAPTRATTVAPTRRTRAPIAPRTRAPTVHVDAPSAHVSQYCEQQSDCANVTTFCQGAAACIDGQCRHNSSYDVCAEALQAQQHVHPMGLLTVLCSNELQSCITSYTCTRDSDCNDGLYCSGVETCVAGSCVAGVAVVCEDNARTCSEQYHCGDVAAEDVPTEAPTGAPTNAPPDDQALMIFAIVFGVAALVLILIAVIFIIRSQAAHRQVILNANAQSPANMSPFATSVHQGRRNK